MIVPAGSSTVPVGISASALARAARDSWWEAPAPSCSRIPARSSIGMARRRSGSGLIAVASSARTVTGSGSSLSIARTAGTSSRCRPTRHDSGLPGRPVTSVPLGAEPHQTGCPGCVAIRQKSSVTPSSSNAGLTWSRGPTETPPVETTRSASASAAAKAKRVASARSGTLSTRTISQPAAASVAQTSTELDSWICPRSRGDPGGTSSSPVVRTTTRGRRMQATLVRPSPATADVASGLSRVPGWRTTSPACTSAPTCRTKSPLAIGAVAVTKSSTTSTRSIGTIASAPAGSTPPVAIAAAVPATSGAGLSPARM